jgi:hypothetical protein
MSQYIARASSSSSSSASPYAYRLPPDTFLSRRDPGWYIGATPTTEQKAEIDYWTKALASLQQSEAVLIASAEKATDGKAKTALLQQVIPQAQQQIQNALMKLQAAQRAAGVQVTVPSPESFAQLEALVKKAREDFVTNADAWISDMQLLKRFAPEFIESMVGLKETILKAVFDGSVPRLMLRVKSGELSKQKDIERLLKISADALKSQYLDTVKAFRDMGPVSTLLFRACTGLVQSAEAIGRYALKVVVETVKEVIKEAQEQAMKNPLGFTLVAGGAFAMLALYLYMKK